MTETATAATAPAPTAGANIQVSAMSRFAPASAFYTALVIGSNRPDFYKLDPNPDDSFWWLVVVDLTTLNVVANCLANGHDVPPDVQPYLNNPQYFLFCLGNCCQGWQIPYGPFYDFLQNVGAGPQLARLEQVYHQLKSGIIHYYTYILAASMDTTDFPGFEASSFTDPSVLAMEFMPVTVDGKTIYTPINPFP